MWKDDYPAGPVGQVIAESGKIKILEAVELNGSTEFSGPTGRA